MNKSTQVFIIVIVLIATAFIFLFQMSPIPNPAVLTKSSSPSIQESTNIQEPSPLVTTSASSQSGIPILVDDQPVTANILVKEVNIPENGYAIIHAVSKDNLIGGAIGNSELLTQGTHANLKLTVYGQGGKAYVVHKGDQFIIMLYKDNGDGKYGKADLLLPIKDSKGVILSKQFKVF